jgi:hypothetical protein
MKRRQTYVSLQGDATHQTAIVLLTRETLDRSLRCSVTRHLDVFAYPTIYLIEETLL